MQRRTFLTSLAAAFPAFAASNEKLKISAVEIWRIEGRRPPQAESHGYRVSSPQYIYDELRPGLVREGNAAQGGPMSLFYVKIKTDAGPEGFYGPVFANVCSVVDQQLGPFLIGKDPLAGETLWEEMYRSNHHSQGFMFQAISAVDNTLWDLRGRHYGVPVYRLLGGPTRPAVEVYASCIDLSVDPEQLPGLARRFQQQGYQYQKWFMAYGPGDGPEGLRKNVEVVRILRETLGENAPFMIDAFMSWDLNYALEFAHKVERYAPHWLEEPFLPDSIQSFVELRKGTTIPIASGEHLYGRWAAGKYLRAGAVGVLQTDVDWCGGISESLKICAIASEYGVPVIPHGDCLHPALHLIASQSPNVCPLAEYMVNRLHAGQWKYYFEKNPLVPVTGKITLSERPGFGIELDPSRVEKQTKVTSSWS